MLRLALAGLIACAALPALAHDHCRPPRDLPPGVKAPQRVGCPAEAPREPGLRPGRTPGFVDVGNGTEVRISGRVRFEAGGSR